MSGMRRRPGNFYVGWVRDRRTGETGQETRTRRAKLTILVTLKEARVQS